MILLLSSYNVKLIGISFEVSQDWLSRFRKDVHNFGEGVYCTREYARFHESSIVSN